MYLWESACWAVKPESLNSFSGQTGKRTAVFPWRLNALRRRGTFYRCVRCSIADRVRWFLGGGVVHRGIRKPWDWEGLCLQTTSQKVMRVVSLWLFSLSSLLHSHVLSSRYKHSRDPEMTLKHEDNPAVVCIFNRRATALNSWSRNKTPCTSWPATYRDGSRVVG